MQEKGKMKRFIYLLFILLILISCSAEDTAEEFSVVAVDFPSFDAARAILGGDDNLTMLLPPGTESHSYDPTPRDMVRLSESDLVIYTGGPSDAWVDSILSSLENPPASFVLTKQVELLSEEKKEGMEADEHEGHEHDQHEIDEHVWTSPVNEMTIIRNLASLLETINPEEAVSYEANALEYIDKIGALDHEIREIVDNAPRRTLIFASRFPLLYFVREYDLDYYAGFPGCAEETEPSAKTVAFLIDKAEELNVPCILNIELSSDMIARVIASEAGCGIRTFNTLHNVTAADFHQGKTYIDLMGENLDVLREALY